MFLAMKPPHPNTTQPASPARDIYPVSRLNREVKALLEGNFPALWVEGEISNLSRPASGHMYFSLKDAGAQVRCALFRGSQRLLGFEPRDGLHVLARARVSLYEGRGDFQLIVEYLEEAGEGALRRAFEILKQRLAQEGLFDPERKKTLPRLPKRIGLITSPSGAGTGRGRRGKNRHRHPACRRTQGLRCPDRRPRWRLTRRFVGIQRGSCRTCPVRLPAARGRGH